MKIVVEWTTGANITGCYSGRESLVFEYTKDTNIYALEKQLLASAARKLGWDGKLKRVSTMLTNA